MLKIDLQLFGGRGGNSSRGKHGMETTKKIDDYHHFKLVTPKNEKYPHSEYAGFVARKASNKYVELKSGISHDGNSVMVKVDNSNVFTFSNRYGGGFGLKVDQHHVVFGNSHDYHEMRDGTRVLRFNKDTYKIKESTKTFSNMSEHQDLSWDKLKKIAKAQDDYRKKHKQKFIIHRDKTPWQSDIYFLN